MVDPILYHIPISIVPVPVQERTRPVYNIPSYTTHALQPCNVACFGPLASAWKSEVNSASVGYVGITKQNLLVFYAKARECALKKSTIIAIFT